LGDPGQALGLHVLQTPAVEAEQVMVLVERGLIARRASGKRKGLDQADLAQNLQGPVDRPQADPGHFVPDPV